MILDYHIPSLAAWAAINFGYWGISNYGVTLTKDEDNSTSYDIYYDKEYTAGHFFSSNPATIAKRVYIGSELIGSELTVPEGVTSVGNNAFANINGITSITLPSTLVGLYGSAFDGCQSLTTIACLADSPPTISGSYRIDSFGGHYYLYLPVCVASWTLKVPYGKSADYAAATYWNTFKEILELEQVDDYMPGDVNSDGRVTPSDAIMILYHYFDVEQTGFNVKAADVNGDGSITPADAIETLYIYFNDDNQSNARQMQQTLDPQ